MPARSPLRTVLKVSLTTCSVLTHLGPVIHASTAPARPGASTGGVNAPCAAAYVAQAEWSHADRTDAQRPGELRPDALESVAVGSVAP